MLGLLVHTLLHIFILRQNLSLKRVLICLDFHQPLFKGRLTRTRTNGKENKRLGQGLGFLILLSIKNINPLGLSDVDLNHTRT